ncbi:hypothetical protein LINGRAPRIM_LOCUS366 [Linum grandiflorum]
MMVLRS